MVDVKSAEDKKHKILPFFASGYPSTIVAGVPFV